MNIFHHFHFHFRLLFSCVSQNNDTAFSTTTTEQHNNHRHCRHHCQVSCETACRCRSHNHDHAITTTTAITSLVNTSCLHPSTCASHNQRIVVPIRSRGSHRHRGRLSRCRGRTRSFCDLCVGFLTYHLLSIEVRGLAQNLGTLYFSQGQYDEAREEMVVRACLFTLQQRLPLVSVR